jgi:hypothetical protein
LTADISRAHAACAAICLLLSFVSQILFALNPARSG